MGVAGGPGPGGPLQNLSGAILHVWRWKQFNESRWCTIGASCRALVASLAVGLEAVVDRALSDPASSNYHLNGFKRLRPEVRRYAVVAALAAFPAEALQVELLEDDRVARRLPELKGAFDDELVFLEQLPPQVWDRLARHVGGYPAELGGELRSASVRSAYTSRAYIEDRLFRIADDFPWRLAFGDIQDNLEKLHSEPYQGHDRATQQIKQLLQIGFPRSQLGDLVALLREVPWTTVTVEQAHGSMAVLHRQHPGLGRKALAHRTMIHQCRALFQNPQAEKVLGRIEKRLERLRGQTPESTTGRHLFLRDLMAQARSSLPQGSRMSLGLRQQIMRRHGGLYKSLPLAARQEYGQAASRHIENANVDRMENITAALHDYRLYSARLTQEALERGMTNRVADSRFSEADLRELGQHVLAVSKDAAGRVAGRLRAEAPPGEPSAAQMAVFASHPVATTIEGRGAPELYSLTRELCWRREFYRGCALFRDDVDIGEKAFLFLYGTQSPIAAVFLELTRTLPDQHSAQNEDYMGPAKSFLLHFSYLPCRFVPARHLPFPDCEDVFVVEDLAFTGNNMMVTDVYPTPMKEFASRCLGVRSCPFVKRIPPIVSFRRRLMVRTQSGGVRRQADTSELPTQVPIVAVRRPDNGRPLKQQAGPGVASCHDRGPPLGARLLAQQPVVVQPVAPEVVYSRDGAGGGDRRGPR